MNAPQFTSSDGIVLRTHPSLILRAAMAAPEPHPSMAGMERARHDGPERQVEKEHGYVPLPGTVVQTRKGEQWLMPVAICEAVNGYDTKRAPHTPSEHLIEWHLAPSRIQQVLPSGPATETLPSNGFVIRPAGMALQLVAVGPARFVHFVIPDAFLRAVAADWLGDAVNCTGLLGRERLMRTDPAIVPMLDAYLRRALDEDEPPTRLEMDSRAHLVVLQILRRHSVLVERQNRLRRGGLAPYQLKRVCELMTRDLAEEISLTELANTIGISYHHFCHAFKTSTGQPPRQWLVERRVEAACGMLRTTRLSVTEIAATIGYTDQNQFLRVFRSRRGTTPSAYRREFQDHGGAGAA
ncbi:AraC family transcriptional regulator [Cupriavidus necator]|uniref:AraC family transcriptional regulator n=1 Tax=Cupriavidus necator TaxID=106590 RepID=UPI0039C2FA66